MVEQSKLLRKRLRILRGTNRIVKRSDPDSFYAAIAADGDFGDGVNPSCVIADEVHRWKTRKQLENWDVLTNGGFTRRQTLTIAITTAGVQAESPLAWRLHEKTRKINQGVVHDPTFFGRIYGASVDDDPADPRTWIKANPSLIENGGFLDKEKIRQQYVSHLAEGDLSSFNRYFLNIWDQKEHRAIDMNQWRQCRHDWDASGWPLPHDLLAKFINRKCWVGVDVSMTTDLSAVAAVFPRDDGGYDVLPFCWMPAATLRRREVQDGMPYQRWVEEGWIETCEGRVIDNGLIKARIKYCVEMFEVQEVCLDRYNSREMSTKLIEEGIPCIEIPQTHAGLNEATKKLISLVVAGDLVHGGHPVMAHHASCLCTKSDGNDLIKPVKPDREKDFSRIDLLAATIDGLARALVFEDKSIRYSPLLSVGP
jgi:phage terminase large subunit-like protein